MDAAFTPVDALQQGGPITSSIFPASCKGGADWLIPVVEPRQSYGHRTPAQEKARLDGIHDEVLEELRQTRRAEGKSYADFPRDLPADEGEKLLTRLSSGEVTLLNLNSMAEYGFNAGATRGLPGTPCTRFGVASAPGADKALFSATLRSCAHLGAGLAVVWESTWGDAWWALWRANIDAFHEKGMDLLVLFSGDAKAGEANIGFAQSMEVLYLQERRVPFSTMAITDFKRYTQGAVLTQAKQNAWVALEPTLRLRPGSVACQLRSISGGTALHVAAGCRAPASCLAALVRCGWEANAKDDAGFTPLHAAAAGVFDEEVERVKAGHFCNCPEQVAELLRLRADPKATDRENCMTPLHSAATFSGSTEVAQLLIQGRADVEARNSSKSTPLIMAAWKGHPQVVSLLLAARAAMEAKDTYERTPLFLAAMHGHPEVAQLLIQGRADVEARNSWKNTPLIMAAWKGHPQVVALLLASHADVAAQTTRGNTPLGLAAFEGHTQVASLLLTSGAAIEAKGPDDLTPLISAAKAGKTEVVQLLLQHGADVAANAINGNTALIEAAAAGHAEVAQLLIQGRADVEARNSSKNTPLIMAAWKGHPQVAKLLMEAGADPEFRNIHGESPRDMARRFGKEEVLEVLRKPAGRGTGIAAGTSSDCVMV